MIALALRRITATAVAALCAPSVAAAGAQSTASPDIVWVQYEADGRPHVRVITANATCPSLTVGATTTALAVRSPAAPAFPDTVCDLPLPDDAHGARIGTTALPGIPREPKTIAMFGDSGCRLKGAEVQACNDPAAWPFPTVARDIAAAHPDLVIDVGDYYYRETPCPGTVDCTNSPHGDNAGSWMADYFTPMVPVFGAAPMIHVRGNHEDCTRSPAGWARYLSGRDAVACTAHEPVAYAQFTNLLVGEVDDATESTETMPAPPVFGADEADVDARAAGAHRETWLIVHRPPALYEATHQHGDTLGPHVDAIISGHIHTFGAYTLPGEPAQLIVGTGGDNLAADSEVQALSILGGVTDRRFGYAIFTRSGTGWDIAVHDTTTAVHRRCRLVARTVSCGPALTT